MNAMKENQPKFSMVFALVNYCADFTVFIATWLKSLDIYQNKDQE